MVQASKKSGAGTADIYQPKWEYYKELEFLIPTLIVREGTDNIADKSSK